MRCRIDFKYALGLELDDPGFHHSVLSDFRDRLADGDRADRLLDLAVARLTEAGLVRERTTARTDSTHVLAPVLGSRPCDRSLCRTTTATRRGVCAGAPTMTAVCRPRRWRSSLPTTPRPVTRVEGRSPGGRDSWST
ncbi:transposase [Nocardia sp. NPDC004711]